MGYMRILLLYTRSHILSTLKGHYRVWDSGFRVSSLRLSVCDFGFRVQSSEFRVWGLIEAYGACNFGLGASL